MDVPRQSTYSVSFRRSIPYLHIIRFKPSNINHSLYPASRIQNTEQFATPYLILTMYTDLAETHGIVLLRGEITPSTASGSPDRYMLSQADAQLLAMTLQKFYLWSENGSDLTGEKLLHTFHQNPQDFKWQELLEFSNTTS